MASTVTKLEELEALEAALAEAEAVLADAVINAAKLDADRIEANANLDKARARCRQIHTALAELDRSESTAPPDERIDTQIRQLEKVSKRRAAATLPSRHIGEHAVRADNKRARGEFQQRKPIRRIKSGLSAQQPGPENPRPRPSLLRQTIDLLALTLAYLQFYFFDVQLQILTLPSIIALPLQ